jgi:Fur family transcriptional regulator, zinc uptake regulator
MKNVTLIIKHAEQHCADHGTRLTEKRKQVLAGLVQSDIALSAYELIDVCKEKYGEGIRAMSIYRILDFLETEKLAHKLNLANKYVACAHISCDHAHGVPQFLICRNCSKVKEISISQSTITELKETVKNAGYHLVSPQLELNCLCESCKSSAA